MLMQVYSLLGKLSEKPKVRRPTLKTHSKTLSVRCSEFSIFQNETVLRLL